MPTFLTNPRMPPALRARVAASVRGNRPALGSHVGPRVVAVARFGGALLVVALVAFAGQWWKRARSEEARARAELARDRSALAEEARVAASELSDADRGYLARASAWLARSAAAYEGDVIAPELQAPDAFGRTLRTPITYARGPLSAFADGRTHPPGASRKDAFLLCLLEPPAARSEKALLPAVQAAYGAEASIEERTANVRSLEEVRAAMPLLDPSWASAVEATDDARALADFRMAWSRAPIARAKQAMRAPLLLLVADEPDAPGATTELDGEHPHAVRVTLVDLPLARVLFRARRSVDPGWVSEPRRLRYARGFDGCALAYDLRKGS